MFFKPALMTSFLLQPTNFVENIPCNKDTTLSRNSNSDVHDGSDSCSRSIICDDDDDDDDEQIKGIVFFKTQLMSLLF